MVREHVHLIGIGGTGMASLAGLFHDAGCRVTGSDGPLYPPTSTILTSPVSSTCDSPLTPRIVVRRTGSLVMSLTGRFVFT